MYSDSGFFSNVIIAADVSTLKLHAHEDRILQGLHFNIFESMERTLQKAVGLGDASATVVAGGVRGGGTSRIRGLGGEPTGPSSSLGLRQGGVKEE